MSIKSFQGHYFTDEEMERAIGIVMVMSNPAYVRHHTINGKRWEESLIRAAGELSKKLDPLIIQKVKELK